MKKIVIHNLKGGVGKTTTAANFAYNLSKAGKKVLLVDSDKQGNLSNFFGVVSYGTNMLTDVFMGKCAISEAVRKTKYKNLDIIPADISLLEANQRITKPDILCKALAAIEDKYDYCIFDCAPNIDIIMLNILVCADEVIIPVKIDGFAIDGVNGIMQQVENVRAVNDKLRLRGCLVTNFVNDELTKRGVAELEALYKVFAVRIPYTKKVLSSISFGQVLDEHSPMCGAAKGYRKFVEEYLQEV